MENVDWKLRATSEPNNCETGKIRTQRIKSRLLDDSFVYFFRQLHFNILVPFVVKSTAKAQKK